VSGSFPTLTADVPATVEEAVAWAARMAARRAHATWRPSNGARRYGIQLRRFAGPAVYRKQVSHLRIAHLTDLHVGRITPFEVQRTATEMTNAQHPDLILLSGDFVCHSQLYLDQLAEVIRMFEAPVIAVLGNHDYWSGADEVRQALERGAAQVQSKPQHNISIRGEGQQVDGLADA
jgi:predicted MPP superfamily phosphohydrolase